MSLAGITPIKDRPRYLTCGKPCKPRYRYTCRDCRHADYQHPMTLGNTCAVVNDGNRCPCAHFGIGRDWSTYFERDFSGYDLLGLFHSQTCAIQWALKHALQGGAK
jgi:hypothetical protein